MILHLLSLVDWAEASQRDDIRPVSLEQEGFVHCTGDDETMLAVANRFYRWYEAPVLVIDVDETRLLAETIWEPPAHPDGRPAEPGAPLFPHVYGPITLDAVRRVRPLVRDAEGEYVGYGEPFRGIPESLTD